MVCLRARALDLEFTHVAYIKDAGSRSHCHVFLQRTRILNRHVPSCKLHHPGSQLPVDGV